jgi:hypothetical protein
LPRDPATELPALAGRALARQSRYQPDHPPALCFHIPGRPASWPGRFGLGFLGRILELYSPCHHSIQQFWRMDGLSGFMDGDIRLLGDFGPYLVSINPWG